MGPAFDLNGADLANSGLKELAALKNLTALNLEGATVSDAGLKELAGLKKIS